MLTIEFVFGITLWFGLVLSVVETFDECEKYNVLTIEFVFWITVWF